MTITREIKALYGTLTLCMTFYWRRYYNVHDQHITLCLHVHLTHGKGMFDTSCLLSYVIKNFTQSLISAPCKSLRWVLNNTCNLMEVCRSKVFTMHGELSLPTTNDSGSCKTRRVHMSEKLCRGKSSVQQEYSANALCLNVCRRSRTIIIMHACSIN